MAVQAELEAERLHLQDRLRDALDSRMEPRMQVDTSSPIDRTVNLLDNLLQASLLYCGVDSAAGQRCLGQGASLMLPSSALAKCHMRWVVLCSL